MLNLLSDDARRDPYPMYAQLRATSPLLHVPAGDFWVVSDYEGVKRALQDHETFGSNAAPARGIEFEWLLFLDPPRHTQLRAIVSRAFTPRSVAELEPRIRDISRRLIDAVVDRGAMDLVDDYGARLPLMVIAEMVGLPVTELPRLKLWSDAIVNLGTTIVGTALDAKLASAAFLGANDEMADYLAHLESQRRAEPRDDLLTRLLFAEVDGARLTEKDILRFIQLLLAAGSETTTNLIDNAILCFLEHRDALDTLRREPSRLPSAIEEVLRYRSPAQVMFRTTRRDAEMHGQVIPKGKFVMVAIGAANRDPRAFPEPDRFDIARQPNPHLAFGHGIHFCIGAPLSRLEARIALGDLLARLDRIERADDAPWPPRPAFHVHGPTRLPIRFRRAG